MTDCKQHEDKKMYCNLCVDNILTTDRKRFKREIWKELCDGCKERIIALEKRR